MGTWVSPAVILNASLAVKESIIPYGIAFMVAWAVTYFTTPFCMRLAVRFGLLDSPSERRVHTRVIPRNGGLAVFLGVHTSLLVIWFFGKDTALLGISAGEWLPYLLASTVLLLVGLYDDAFSLSPLKKLAGQCFAALILWKFGVQVGNIMGVQLPVFFNLMLTLLWFGFIINAFNLIDGYDGLASGLSIVSGVGIAGTLLS
ncbi:MAG: undecaprenyl/decaprenyl-phosphate alpha-N-acetylglucosaminyl 1-phosphate transferase, partial [Bdellovibrionales bacterium]|nr:undecaprenyl/decaprenyl-phosphate alpha-N-acetylglucosaminyl 1-phosphate transferase [Bdellovibrionales bacterium]